MNDICKIYGDGASSDCDAKPTEKLEFEFGGERLSRADKRRKAEVKKQLIEAAKKCYDDGECDGLNIVALRWDKCGACNRHLPSLVKEVVEPLRKAGISVSYEERDAKVDGKDFFKRAGCQGTPCVLVKDPITGDFKKGYEGVQKDVGALSMLLGLPNPLFYGDITDQKPSNMLKKSAGRYFIKNNRSMWL